MVSIVAVAHNKRKPDIGSDDYSQVDTPMWHVGQGRLCATHFGSSNIHVARALLPAKVEGKAQPRGWGFHRWFSDSRVLLH